MVQTRGSGVEELTATAVQGRKTSVMAAIVFMELLSAFITLESACVTRLNDCELHQPNIVLPTKFDHHLPD
jgi:hypothetical protein